MTGFITVEPARERRGLFAVWCLEQVPPIQTSSMSGFDVPVDLYPSVPYELLDGAYVDGFLYNSPMPQPVPEADPETAVFTTSARQVDPEPVAEADPEPRPKTPPRKRAPGKPRTSSRRATDGAP